MTNQSLTSSSIQPRCKRCSEKARPLYDITKGSDVIIMWWCYNCNKQVKVDNNDE